MNPVVHFEMPAENRKRMADFYTNVFGWKALLPGEDMGNYVTVSTTETDEKGRSKMPGIIHRNFVSAIIVNLLIITIFQPRFETLI